MMHVREECNSILLAHCNGSDTIDKDAVKQNHTEQNQKGPDDTYTCIWLSVALKQTCFAPTDDAHEKGRVLIGDRASRWHALVAQQTVS